MYDKNFDLINSISLNTDFRLLNNFLSEASKIRQQKQKKIMVMLNDGQLDKVIHNLINRNSFLIFLLQQGMILNVTIDQEIFVNMLNRINRRLPNLILYRIENINCNSINSNEVEAENILCKYVDFDEHNNFSHYTDEKLKTYINSNLRPHANVVVKSINKYESGYKLKLEDYHGNDKTILKAKIEFSTIKTCLSKYFICTNKGNDNVSISLNY